MRTLIVTLSMAAACAGALAAPPTGVASALTLTVAFLVYQRWRFAVFDVLFGVATQRMPNRSLADN